MIQSNKPLAVMEVLYGIRINEVTEDVITLAKLISNVKNVFSDILNGEINVNARLYGYLLSLLFLLFISVMLHQ